MATSTLTAAPDGTGTQGDAPDAKPRKSKKKLLLVLLLVLLAAGAAWFFLLRDTGPKKPVEPKKGAVVVLDSINVNLADGHYLKLGMALQGSAKPSEEITGSEALDIAIDTFSGDKMTDLASTKGRRAAKDELMKGIRKAYHSDVLDVYFTEFVMQ